MQHRALTTLCFVLSMIILAVSGPSHAATVGVTAAVNPRATGQPPGATVQILNVGDDLARNERIVTEASGQAQLLFADGSALTLGHNTDVVLDEFVYDADAKVGTLAFSALKGVFRLVGGRISKKTPITIKFPNTLIGIRGGIAVINAVSGQPIKAFFLFGDSLTVVSAGVTQTATRHGSVITIPVGAPPEPPRLIAQGELATTNAMFEKSSPETTEDGSTSGSQTSNDAAATTTTQTQETEATEDQALAETEISDTNETAIEDEISMAGIDDTVEAQANETESTQEIQEAQTTEQEQIAVAETPTTFVGRFTRQDAYGSAVVTLNSNTAERIAGNNDTIANPVLVGDNRIRVTLPTGDATFPFIAGDGNISLDASNSSSPFGVSTGTGFVSSASDFFFYRVQGTDSKNFEVFGGARTATFPTSGFGAYDLDGRTPTGAGVPFFGQLVPSTEAALTGASISRFFTRYSSILNFEDLPVAERATGLQVSLGINGTGSTQSSFLTGYTTTIFNENASTTNGIDIGFSGSALGSYRTTGTGEAKRLVAAVTTAETTGGNAVFGTNADEFVTVSERLSFPGGTTAATRTIFAPFIQTHATRTLTTEANTVTFGTRNTSAETALASDSRTARNFFGYTAGIVDKSLTSGSAAQPFVFQGVMSLQTDPSSNRLVGSFSLVTVATDASAQVDLLNGSQVRDTDVNNTIEQFFLPFGSVTGKSGGRSAFITDEVYGARESNLLDATLSVDNGVNQTLRNRLFMVNAKAIPDITNVVTALGHAPCTCSFMSWGFWLTDARNAGTVAPERGRVHIAPWLAGSAVAFGGSTNGTVTYNGHALGNVVNGSAQYLAAGGFTGTFNFDTSSGTVSITNFDGMSFSGAVQVPMGQQGDFAGMLSGSGLVGYADGQIFASATDINAGMGGVFNVTGTNYKAAGVFLGQR